MLKEEAEGGFRTRMKSMPFSTTISFLARQTGVNSYVVFPGKGAIHVCSNPLFLNSLGPPQ